MLSLIHICKQRIAAVEDVRHRISLVFPKLDFRVHTAMGKFMDEIKKGTDANEALKKVTGTYGRVTAEQGAVKSIDPRHE